VRKHISDCLLIWDLSTKQVRKNLENQNVYFSFVCFSPDGKTLASAGPRNSLTLWDVETWTQKGTLEPHSNVVRCLEFSPDGKLLAAGVSHYNRNTQKAEVKLWNIESGEEVGTLEHRWAIQTVSFTTDGKALAVADEGQVILWDVESLQHRQVIDTLATNSSRVTISPDGASLAMCRAHSLSLNETKTGNPLATIPANQHFDRPSFSPNGTLLAWPNSAPGESIGLWDLTRLKPLVVSP
jgi:WD40 repeat protein